MPKCLFIAKHDPFGVGGGSFATHAYLKAFSKIFNGQIDICVADSVCPVDKEIQLNKIYYVPARLRISRCMSFITGEMHRYTRFVKNLLKKEEYDYCVFSRSEIAGSLVRYVNKQKIKTITFHHDYEPEYFKDNCTNSLLRFLFLRHVVRMERRGYIESLYNIFLTKQDFSLMQKAYGMNNAHNAVIGTFEYGLSKKQIRKKTENKKNNFVFAITGSLCDHQTIDGVKYFFEKLYDFLPKDSSVIIAGKNPNDVVKKICSEKNNVTLVPNPADMSDILSSADVYICPTRIGGGMKLRVMDGLKNGLPVISHSVSARGYDYFCEKGLVHSFSNEDQFNSALNVVLNNISNNLINCYEIYKEYDSFFSFEAGYNRLKNFLKDVTYER